MSKRKVGLQKDFAAIFEGVWIPKKTRTAAPSAATQPAQQPSSLIEQMRQIADRIRCPKGFECINSNLQNLCKARLVADGQLLECVSDSPGGCPFKITFVGKSLCKCQLRFFIAKNLGK